MPCPSTYRSAAMNASASGNPRTSTERKTSAAVPTTANGVRRSIQSPAVSPAKLGTWWKTKTAAANPSSRRPVISHDGRAQHVDHVLLVVPLEARVERQRQRAGAAVLRDRQHPLAEAEPLAHV